MKGSGLGRTKGAKNHFTREILDALRESFHRLGGTEWLIKLGQEDPASYARLVAKVMPTQIEGEVRTTLEQLLTGTAGDEDEPEDAA